MKKRSSFIVIAAALLLIGFAAMPLWAQNTGRSGGSSRGAASSQSAGGYSTDFSGSIETVIADIEPGTLTAEEEAGILLMREEEKLARDVYLTLAEKWNIPVFSNIARSEETHMEAMGMLIQRYGLSDPIEETAARGQYTNETFDALYSELTERGSASLEEALKVGAFIEDLDIADLQRLIDESVNDDVKIVYQNLLKGSRNHLRSFYRQVSRYDSSYIPEYISQADFDRIISSSNESGVIDEPDFRF